MKSLAVVLALLLFGAASGAGADVILNCADQDGLDYTFSATSSSPQIQIKLVADAIDDGWARDMSHNGKQIAATGNDEVYGVFFPVNKNGKSGMFFTFETKQGQLKVHNAGDLIAATKNLKSGIDQIQTFSTYAGSVKPDGDVITGSYATCYVHLR